MGGGECDVLSVATSICSVDGGLSDLDDFFPDVATAADTLRTAGAGRAPSGRAWPARRR